MTTELNLGDRVQIGKWQYTIKKIYIDSRGIIYQTDKPIQPPTVFKYLCCDQFNERDLDCGYVTKI